MVSLTQRAEQAQARLETATRRSRLVVRKPAFHALTRGDSIQGPIDSWIRAIRREERQAEAKAEDIAYEPRSQEQDGSDLDENGYMRDDFVVDDDLASSVTSDVDSSSDTSLYCDSQPPEVDAELPGICLDAVTVCYPTRSPPFPFSCTDDERLARSHPITFKTPGHRVLEMELLLSSWVQCDLSTITHRRLAFFFELLHHNESEFVASVFKHFIRRFEFISLPFCRFVWKVIKACTLQHASLFSDCWNRYHVLPATRQQQSLQNQQAATPPDASPQPQRSAPRTRRPEIKHLDDIKHFMSVFLVEYGKYERDHRKSNYGFDSLFQCLTPAQQKTLSSTTSTPLNDCMALSNDDVCELVRFAFGKKSIAAADQFLKSIRFTGDSLVPADWSKFFQLFTESVQEIHHRAMPPSDKIAKTFLRACPFPYMRSTLLIRKHADLDDALNHVNALLNDPEFLRDTSKALALAKQQHPRDRDRPHANHSSRGDPKPAHEPTQFPRHPLPPPVHGQSAAPLQRRGPPCARCQREGCVASLCIRRRDKDGAELPRLDNDEYKRRKEAIQAKGASTAAVAAIFDSDGDASDGSLGSLDIQDSSSDFSDEYCAAVVDAYESRSPSPSALHYWFSDEEMALLPSPAPLESLELPSSHRAPPIHGIPPTHNDFACAILPESIPVCDVPDPSLLEDGDVESNPGPRRLRNVYLRPPPKQIWSSAFILMAAAPSLPTAASAPPVETLNIPLFPAKFSTMLLDSPASLIPHFLFSSVLMLAFLSCITMLAWRCARVHNALALSLSTVCQQGHNWNCLFFSLIVPKLTRLNPYILLCAMALLLLRCGDVERNPGPINWHPHCHQTMPDLASDSDSSDDDTQILATSVPAAVSAPTLTVTEAVHHPSSDTLDFTSISHLLPDAPPSPEERDDAVVAASLPPSTLLSPPFFIGFVTPPKITSIVTPPPTAAIECALDSMCLGMSIIRKSVADAFSLPREPCKKQSRTATGQLVLCTEIAHFNLHVYISGSWFSVAHSAMVWETAALPLLLCQSFITSSMFVYFCHPQEERIRNFGAICFSRDWHSLLEQENAVACAAYEEDVMPLDIEELTDLSAPLRWGAQDPASVPPDGRHYARKYPDMLSPIPRDADPRLPQWRAHIDESKLALYSWPRCDLRDLAEDKIPLKLQSPLSQEFDKLIAMHFVEPVTSFPPVSITMRAQLVNKTKTEKRFTVNGSVQKNCMRVSAYPMPPILKILDFVAAFPFRCKLDLKHAYHNLEVHPDDRKFTITIGAGRAVQWRKCVQGFASTGNFFQWAMETILVGVVFVIAAIYLDDLIVVGKTAAECTTNVDTIMGILSSYNFRVAFAKCQFTPSSSISFLGCQLDGLQVSPGPKVAVALGRILPFYNQPTPKTQQKHLYSFLGLCAYLNNHKLGLRQALQPLYDIVAKTPFTFQAQHAQCFDSCMKMLLDLDSYWLPDHDSPIVMITDASGGTTGDGLVPSPGHWAAVLGQRTGDHDLSTPVIFNENFRVLQIQGGAFNDRQAAWSVIEKEYFAIFQGFCRFDQFIRGRHITLLTDSKVLLHAFRSSNQKVRRWYSYVQGFDFDVQHITSEQNALCDAMTRCVSIAQLLPAPRDVGIQPATTRPRRRQPAITAAILPSPFILSDFPILSDPLVSPAAILPDPLISLLIDGDIEPNPGPRPKASAATPAMPPLVSDSDSDDAPIVAPQPLSAQSMAVGPSPRRRQRTTTSPPQQLPVPGPSPQPRIRVPQQLPVPVPSPQRQVRVSRNPSASGSPQHLQPSSESRSTMPGSPVSSFGVNFSSSSSSSPPIPDGLPQTTTFSLVTPDVDSKPDSEVAASFISTFSTALSLSAMSFSMTADEAFMARPDNFRECIVQFMMRNASTRFDIFDGVPIRDVFRQDYLLDVDKNRVLTDTGEVTVSSWREYCQMLLLPTTALDPSAIKIVALLFRVQIILVKDDRHAVINPDSGRRRVFVRVFDNNALEWMCPADDAPPSDSVLRSVNVTIDTRHLQFTQSPPQEQPTLDPRAVPKPNHLELLHKFHCGFTGHPGIEATLAAMRSASIRWKGITRDVKNFIRACPTCAITRIKHASALASAVPDLRTTDRPLSRWHLDHVDLSRCDHTGYKAIIVCVDEVTGYSFLKGSRFKSALEVALGLMELGSLFGMPEYIHSDGGKEFANDVLHQFKAISGLKHSFAIANNPNTNGIAERNVAITVRFVSTISIDFGRHNAWGLFIPLVSRAVNSLPRKCLCGSSPHAFVFSSIHDHDDGTFPSTYFPISPADLSTANLHPPSCNFAQRALYSQQVMANAVCEYRDRLLQASIEKDRVDVPENITVGQQVLIDWSGESNPQRDIKSLPKYRGPYTVTSIHNNTLVLHHSQMPPPPHQPASLVWSRQARIYFCELDFDRAPSDSSASHVPLASPAFGIECILGHQLRQDLPRSVTSAPGYSSQDVRNQYYEVRYYHSPSPRFQRTALRSYEDIAHTYAFDNYVVGNPSLHSHRPVSFMPATWDPRITGRRSHASLAPYAERDIMDFSSSQSD
jgi:hypothetical protein